jgi:hypothetical protein
MLAIRAFKRWSAVLALGLVAGLLIPLAWILHHLAGVSLDAAERVKGKLRALLMPADVRS